MTMRWRGKRRDSLQADIRAYSRYRYAYLTTFFSSFSPLHLLPLKVIQDLCTTYCPLDVASAEWNLLLRFRAGNASSNSHTCILRYLCASVSTRALAPLNIFYIHHRRRVRIPSCAIRVLFFLFFLSIRIRDIDWKRQTKEGFYPFIQSFRTLCLALKFWNRLSW